MTTNNDIHRDPGPSLRGRRVLVTGAASGIGAACARAFSASGAHVIALDRDETAVKRVAASVDGEAVVADLSDLEALESLRLVADIVVNNAGFQHVAAVEQFDPQIFSTMLDVMVQAPFRIARSVLPGMYERGWGRFVHISSVHGHRASAFKASYVTAKHGLEGLSKVLAVEGAPHGVTSNTVAPGYVRTPLVEGQIAEQAAHHGVEPEDVVKDILLARTPVKRLIEPVEVAEAAVFLCGPGSASISGSTLALSGGWLAT